MNFTEHVGKAVLAEAGVTVPDGRLCASAGEVAEAVRALGPCAVKAQVPAGKRGASGGIRLVDTPDAGRDAATDLLRAVIGGHRVDQVLVEQRIDIAQELYVAVLNDPESKGPMILASAAGGMDVEEIASSHPERLRRLPVDIRFGPVREDLAEMVSGLVEAAQEAALVRVLTIVYDVYRQYDADLVEVNPLALTRDGKLLALDCKLSLDDSSSPRQSKLAERASPEPLTALEARGRAQGLPYIELSGNVGILANGAGLTMTTMDVVRYYGGEPANFLEMGGQAYTLGEAALRLVTDNPNVRSLVINFCGAFARTDVMIGGVLAAWDEVQPRVPVFICVNGTGEEEAISMVRGKFGDAPYQVMEDAIRAAVEAAG